ncbi:transcription initiation factor TFIID subunit 11 [Mortierella sp. GBA30]|nr:transcription initiation factor TFIID subunit 11 [Mortierella sp. GBA30]
MDEASPMRPTQADTTAAPPATKKRKTLTAMPSLPKPKKQKLPRNLDSITARNQLPNVPSTGGISKTGQRMVKGPYKKREKKDKDGKVIPAAAASSSTAGAGGRKAKAPAATKTLSSQSGAGFDASSGRIEVGSPSTSLHGSKDDGDEPDGRKLNLSAGSTGLTEAGDGNEAGEAGGEGKDDDEDDHDEEPEYTEYEWTQEANSRDRSKDELKALLDSFSQEQLRRYEVYRRAVLSRPTVKKLVGTILNQQVSQTMAFVVAGFSKVFVGEMVERARKIMEEWGDTGAIRPDHLREAQRRYKKEEQQLGRGAQPPYGYKRRLFCR